MDKIYLALVIYLLILDAVVLAEISNVTDTNNRLKKAHIIKKLKKDFRKLKKQEGAIKLVDGQGDYEGNLEILHNGRWGSICDDEWDYMEANVVCRQLGFERAVKQTTNSHFGQARHRIAGKWQGTVRHCFRPPRAKGLPCPESVCSHMALYGTTRLFDSAEACACTFPVNSVHVQPFTRRFWMDNIYCDGTEDTLARCRFDGWGQSNCEGSEAAGVVCMHEEDTTTPMPTIARPKLKIKDVHRQGIAIRLAGGRIPSEGRLEVKLGNAEWGVVCGDSWSIFEAGVVCKQLGLGYASDAIQTNFFGGNRMPMSVSGIKCHGDEPNLAHCLHDEALECPGVAENVASVICLQQIADLVFDHAELMRTAHLEDRQLYWLQCAMEENCVASQAYKIQKESDNWHLETRRLLRFTARILNAGTADFRPAVPKHLWEWHMCHMHYHSMEVFATFDIIDQSGNRVAEGHKASFCLEDNQCLPGVEPRYKCEKYGDQGISVNCSDIYRHNIDCQWVDISELAPGEYTMKVAVNPEFKVGEMTFDNNAASCELLYTESFVSVHSCKLERP